MKKLYFECSGQEMAWTNPGVKVVSDSVEIYECIFSFDSEWDGYSLVGVFYNGNSKVSSKRNLVDSSCRIPPEVLTDPGDLYIGVVGTKDNKVMPTIKTPTLHVLEGIGDGEFSEEPDPTQLAQINNSLASLYDTVANIKKTIKYRDFERSAYIPSGAYINTATINITHPGISDESITGIVIMNKNVYSDSPPFIASVVSISYPYIGVQALRMTTDRYSLSSNISVSFTLRVYYLE